MMIEVSKNNKAFCLQKNHTFINGNVFRIAGTQSAEQSVGIMGTKYFLTQHHHLLEEVMIRNEKYFKDVEHAACLDLAYDEFNNKTILITGASGLICSFFIDVLMYRNQNYGSNIKIIATGRSVEKAKKRFQAYDMKEIKDAKEGDLLLFLQQDVVLPMNLDCSVDYIIHGASNTHPRAYAQDPVGTITANIFGLYQLLEFARKSQTKRVLVMSSVEIYGENNGEIERFKEEDLGYIDSNTARAGYPESKRVCESLAQSYIAQYDMDVVLGRFCRIYGPTMGKDDSKALAQFIRNAVEEEDIVLKSEGNQLYSYCYVLDAVTAMFTILLKGEKGKVYNVSDEASDVTLKHLANILADTSGKKVVFELPDAVETAGYSKATKALIDSSRLKSLGWKAYYDMNQGLAQTVAILKEQKGRE